MIYENINDFLSKSGVIYNREERKRINNNYNWWVGQDDVFHRVTESDGMKMRSREKYKLRLGGSICNEWASLLMNEKTMITVDNEDTQRFLFGSEEYGIKAELTPTFFDKQNKLINKSFGTGTGACIIKLDNLTKEANGNVSFNENTKLRYNYLDARNIFPIRTKNGEITAVLFITENAGSFTCEKHTQLTDGSWQIQNFTLVMNLDKKLEMVIDENILPVFNSKIKLFYLISPNIINPYSHTGLGLSILDDAVDSLKGVDNSYDLLMSDIIKGKKLVFIDRKLCMSGTPVMNDSGVLENKLLNPIDGGQTLFYTFQRDVSDTTPNYVQEFNPALRVSDSKDAINLNLSLATMKTGLGYDYFSFNDGKVYQNELTFNGSKQVLVRNISKHNLSVVAYLEGLIRAITDLYTAIGKCSKVEHIKVRPDDSFISDRVSEIASMQTDVAMGILSPTYYLQEKYGWTEDEALRRMPNAIPTEEL